MTTADDGTVFGTAGSHCTGRVTAIGDLQITGHYTGFSPDPSTGLNLGMKLLTQDDHGPIGLLGGPEFDRDSLRGTGGTDLMNGAYHVGQVMGARSLSYFGGMTAAWLPIRPIQGTNGCWSILACW